MSEAAITSTKVLEPGEVALTAFGVAEFAGLRGAKLSPAQILAGFVDAEVATSIDPQTGNPRIDRLGVSLDSANIFGNFIFNAEAGVAVVYGDPDRGPDWFPDYVTAKSIQKASSSGGTLKYGTISTRNTATGAVSTSNIGTAVLNGISIKTPFTAKVEVLRPYFTVLIGENQHGQRTATLFYGFGNEVTVGNKLAGAAFEGAFGIRATTLLQGDSPADLGAALRAVVTELLPQIALSSGAESVDVVLQAINSMLAELASRDPAFRIDDSDDFFEAAADEAQTYLSTLTIEETETNGGDIVRSTLRADGTGNRLISGADGTFRKQVIADGDRVTEEQILIPISEDGVRSNSNIIISAKYPNGATPIDTDSFGDLIRTLGLLADIPSIQITDAAGTSDLQISYWFLGEELSLGLGPDFNPNDSLSREAFRSAVLFQVQERIDALNAQDIQNLAQKFGFESPATTTQAELLGRVENLIAGDGSEVPYVVLKEQVDGSGGTERVTLVNISYDLNRSQAAKWATEVQYTKGEKRETRLGYSADGIDYSGLTVERYVNGKWESASRFGRKDVGGVSIIQSTDGAGVTSVDVVIDSINTSFGEIGRVFGSSLGQAFFNDSLFERLVVSPLLTVGVENLFEGIGVALFEEHSGHFPIASAVGVLGDVQKEFFQELKSSGIGAVSSYLTAELIDALGLDGFGGELASTVGNATINTILSNIAGIADGTLEAGTSVFDGLLPSTSTPPGGATQYSGGAIFNAVGSFLGSKLANQIVSADTVAGQLGGSIGGSVGGLIAGKLVGSSGSVLGVKLGVFAGPVGALIGAFLGTLFGTLFGDLIGKTPRSGAALEYDPETGEFKVGASYQRGKASRETAEALAGQVGETLNGVLDLVGGELMNPGEIEAGYYGTYKSQYRYQAERGGAQIFFEDAGDLTAFGVFTALEDMEILGGDLYLKRALSQSLENQKTGPEILVGGAVSTGFRPADYDSNELNDLELETLLGDLTIAQDYSAYQENAPIINALIAASPDSAFAAGWIITLQRAYELGLHRRHAADWHGGWDFFLDGHDAVTGTVSLSRDAATGERLINFTDKDGASRTLGDTVDSIGKDNIQGTANNDTIIVDGAVLDHSASSSGLTIDGAALTANDHDIDGVAAIYGGDGDDVIWGGDRGNDIFGGAGDDALYGGGTADWLYGGDGNDTIDANNSDDGNFLNGGAGDDTLIGRGGSDWLEGGAGVDELDGGDGNDILDGGAGAGDEVRGGRGDDIYKYNLGDGADLLSDEGFAHAAPERPTETVEIAFRFGAASFDRLTALNAGYLRTAWGDRFVSIGDYAANAMAEAVTAEGKAQGGEDRLILGPGVKIENIRLRRDKDGAGAADDLVIEVLDAEGAPTTDSVRLSDWFDPFNRIEWLEFADGQSLRIGDFLSFTVGTADDDVIIGTNGRDFVHAGAGNDIVQLLMGDDIGNGGLGNDFITGDGGDDLVVGGNDHDRVLGGDGRDVVSGDLGDDIVRGDAGDDLLSGGLGDDTVVGGAGNDVIRYSRGDGRDTIFDAYAAADWEIVFDGADGWVSGVTFVDVDHDNDPATGPVTQYRYNGSVLYDGAEWFGAYRFDTTTQVLERHATGAAGDNGSNDTLEFAIGIDIDDIVLQADGGDLLLGLNSSIADDVAFDALTDVIRLQDWDSGARGIEQFVFYNYGAFDIDSLSLMSGGTDGDDVVSGGGGADWLTGGVGDDVVDGKGGRDLIVGHGGDDQLLGGAGNDTLVGGSGDDVLDGGDGSDKLVGGEGFDIASYASASAGVSVTLKNEDTFAKSPIRDVFSGIEGLEGSDHADTLIGDSGNNELIGGDGADRLEGRGGDDSYVFSGDGDEDVIFDRGVDESSLVTETVISEFGALNAPYSEAFTLVDTRVESFGEVYVYDWIVTKDSTGEIVYQQQLEYLTQQSEAPQFFHEDFWRNGFAQSGQGEEVVRVTGSAGLYDGGSDELFWETNDSLSTLDIALSGVNLVISSASGSIRIQDFQNTQSRIETLHLSDGLSVNLGGLIANSAGGAEADFIVGAATADSLNGGAENDVISGKDGADSLFGDDGDDILEGGAGGDVLDGGAGIDAARYLGSSVGVSVDLSTGQGSGGEAEGDTLSGVEVLYGSQHGDTLTGDDADNRLFGREGDDNLSGGEGADILQGGDGADVIDGGAGDDDLDGDDGADVITGGAGVDGVLGGRGDDQLYGGAGNDFLSGEEGDDLLEGGADDDVLTGDDGADTLRGDDGDDTLIGARGNDQLEGGAGDDVYVFDALSGDDVIVDADGVNSIAFSGAAREDLRFDRIGDDLVIKTISASASVTLSDYFQSGGTQAHTITAADHVLYFDHSSAFFDLFADLPIGATAQNAAITDELDRYWHLFGNARPEGADMAIATDEDTVFAGGVAVSDHDENITGYALAGAPSFGVVSVDPATGNFTYTPNPNYFGDDAFYINVEDSGGNVTDILVTVSVAPVNDAPAEVQISGVDAIDENTSDLTLGDLTVIDVDGTEHEHTFSVDDARFEVVDRQLRLRVGQSFNFEDEPSVTLHVTATDAHGASNNTSPITFAITDLNEAPGLGDTALLAAEDVAAGVIIGGITATDPDAGAFGDLRYYFLSSSGDAISVSEDGLFSIDASTGDISATSGGLDFETAASYQLTGLVRDNGGAGAYHEASAAIDISITNVNEAPDGVFLDNSSADENSDGAIVGVLSTTDPDGPAGGLFSQHAYSVDDNRFYVDGANNLRLKAGETLDFETEPQITLNVTATDENGLGLSVSQVFTIDVNDIIDVLNGTSGVDVLDGAQGVDHLFGLGGADILNGAAGADEIDGGADDDALYGGAGDDALVGGSGADSLYGEDGADNLDGGDGEDVLDGGVGVDVLQGGANNDVLYGRGDDDVLQGSDENDLLVGGAGADVLDGGAGEDTASYEDAAAGVVIDLADGANNTGDAAGDSFTSIEVFRGSDHADQFTGDANGNVFYGEGGNDSIIGDDGDDVLYGGAGDDFIDAGDGLDMLDGGEGDDTLVGGADQDLYMISRNSGSDTIRSYDPANADDTISFADDIAYTDLWFERSGDDLVISVIGADSLTTIEDWYASAGAGNAYDISLFLVDDRETRTVDVEQLASVMAQYLVDEGVAKPQTAAEMSAALAVIGGAVDSLWGFSTPPVIDAVNDITIVEDGTLSFTARIYDDKVAAELLTVGAASSDAAIISPADVVFGAADADGYRQVTVTPKEDASGVVTVTLQATDGGSGVTEEPFTVTILAVADMPALAVFSASGNVDGPIALNITADQTDNDLSETLTIEIAGVPASASLSAGVDQGGGVWMLSPADLAGLTLTPATGDASDFDLSVTAISSEGGTSEQITIPMSVTVNGAPSDIAFDGVIDENATNGAIVGDASHTDPDAGGAHVYSLVDDAGGRFAIDGASGQVTVLDGSLLNHEAAASHDIRIRVVDQGGLAREETFTVSVNDVNETFAFDGATLSVAENQASGFDVGHHVGVDPDAGAFGDLRYYFQDGSGVSGTSTDGLFTIDAITGLVAVNGALNFENASSHTYTVIARDNAGAGAYFESAETLTVNIDNVNEAPTDIIPTGALYVSEAAGNGALVADFDHVDPEGGTMSYSLVDNAEGRFAINATTGALTVANAGAVDYEAASSHDVIIRVTDPGGLSHEETFTVAVSDVNEAPSLTGVAATTHTSEPSANVIHMAESKAKLDWDVAYLQHSDPENQTATYHFEHSNGSYSTVSQDGRFKIVGGAIEVNQSVLSYETTPNSLTYAIAARDEGGLYSPASNVTINITDVNEAPNVNGATFNRAETWNPTVSIGTVSSSDPDLSSVSNGQLKFTIIGGNVGTKFNIDNNGRLWLRSALNYESRTSYSLTVKVQDRNGSGLYDTATVRVNVQDVNEIPIVTSKRTYSYQGLPVRHSYTDVKAYDPEGRSLSYSLHNINASHSYASPMIVPISGGARTQIQPQPYGYVSATARLRIYDGVLSKYETVSASSDRIQFLFFPIVLDLDGDGVELLEIENGVAFDVDDDGALERTGWAAPDDGLLAIDRNGDGVIDTGSEISYIDDLEGAETDLEGLTAFDTNANGVIDSGDDQWTDFYVWRDANSDGVSQADELEFLSDANIAAISLQRTLAETPNVEEFEATPNIISAFSEFVLTDGTVRESADVTFAFNEQSAEGGFAAPVVLDLGGDGLDLLGTSTSDVLFDANADGVKDRSAWVGEGDGILALDRNGNGRIDDITEISFVNDLEGASTDLEGLRAFDSNNDGVFSADDEMFGAFSVWVDANRDAISDAGELMSLAEADILWIDLELTSTGAELEDGAEFVVTGISNFVTTAGDIRLAGDVAFRYEIVETIDGAETTETAETDQHAVDVEQDDGDVDTPESDALVVRTDEPSGDEQSSDEQSGGGDERRADRAQRWAERWRRRLDRLEEADAHATQRLSTRHERLADRARRRDERKNGGSAQAELHHEPDQQVSALASLNIKTQEVDIQKLYDGMLGAVGPTAGIVGASRFTVRGVEPSTDIATTSTDADSAVDAGLASFIQSMATFGVEGGGGIGGKFVSADPNQSDYARLSVPL